MKVKVKPGQIRHFSTVAGECYYIVLEIKRKIVTVWDIPYKKITRWSLIDTENDKLL